MQCQAASTNIEELKKIQNNASRRGVMIYEEPAIEKRCGKIYSDERRLSLERKNRRPRTIPNSETTGSGNLRGRYYRKKRA